MVGEVGVATASNFNNVACPTDLTAPYAPKGQFPKLSNLTGTISPRSSAPDSDINMLVNSAVPLATALLSVATALAVSQNEIGPASRTGPTPMKGIRDVSSTCARARASATSFYARGPASARPA